MELPGSGGVGVALVDLEKKDGFFLVGENIRWSYVTRWKKFGEWGLWHLQSGDGEDG